MLHERWAGLPCWVKYTSLTGISCAAILLVELFVAQPQRARINESAANDRLASEKVAVLRHNILSLMATAKATRQRREAMPAGRFSVMEFVRYAGGKLEKWQPESRPAVLEMLLTWERLPALFAHLSRYRAISLRGFSVEPKGEQLQLILMMDISDES